MTNLEVRALQQSAGEIRCAKIHLDKFKKEVTDLRSEFFEFERRLDRLKLGDKEELDWLKHTLSSKLMKQFGEVTASTEFNVAQNGITTAFEWVQAIEKDVKTS